MANKKSFFEAPFELIDLFLWLEFIFQKNRTVYWPRYTNLQHPRIIYWQSIASWQEVAIYIVDNNIFSDFILIFLAILSKGNTKKKGGSNV